MKKLLKAISILSVLVLVNASVVLASPFVGGVGG